MIIRTRLVPRRLPDHSDRRVTAWGESPSQRAAQVVEFGPVFGEPFGRGSRLDFRAGPLEQVAIIFRMTPRNALAFAVFDEFLKRVYPRRVEQTIVRDAISSRRRRAIWRPDWKGSV